METRTDTELIVAFASSADEPAFDELVRRHQQMVFQTCLRMLGNVQEAQDAAQATLIVLMKKAGTLKREGSLGGWLHAVARRIALDALRQRNCQAKSQEAAAWQMEACTAELADVEAVLGFLDEELGRLSNLQEQAVVLRYLEGHSEKEAAQMAGCPVGTIGRRASDGIARLRQRLARRGVTLGVSTLVGVLVSEASAAAPKTILPSLLTALRLCSGQAVKSAAATGAAATTASTTAAMLAKGAMKAMFIAKVKLATVVGLAIMGAVVGWLVTQVAGKKAESGPPVRAKAVMVCLRDCDLSDARHALAREGVHMFILGADRSVYSAMMVPAALRCRRMPARGYVEAIAVDLGRRTVWRREGSVAILEQDVAANEMEDLKKGLASRDIDVRRRAVERAGRTYTVEALRLLMAAASDREPTVAQEARDGLEHLGWGAALTLDDRAWPLLEAQAADPFASWSSPEEVAMTGDKRSLAILRQTMKDPTRREECILALGLVAGTEARRELETLLRDGDVDTRLCAILAMLDAGYETVIPALEKELREASPYVRQQLSGSIAWHPLGRDKLSGEPVKSYLRRTMRQTTDGRLRIMAGSSLCATGDREGLAFVTSIARTCLDYPQETLQCLALALVDNGSPEALLLLKETFLRSDNQRAKFAGAYALAWVADGAITASDLRDELSEIAWLLGGTEAVQWAAAALRDSEPRVRSQGASRLVGLNPRQALPLLENAIMDSDATVRKAAVSSLGWVGAYLSIGQAEPVVATLEKALTDPDADVRAAATGALGYVGGESALATLQKILAGSDAKARYDASAAVSRMDGARVVALREKLLADPNPGVRAMAIWALESIGRERRMQWIRKAIVDKHAAVRWQAVSGLRDADAKEALPLIQTALADQDAAVRGAAVWALLNDKTTALPGIEKLVADSDVGVRVTIGRALEDLGDGKAMPLLEKLLADPEESVRHGAFRALCRMGGDTAQPLIERALSDPDVKARRSYMSMFEGSDYDKPLAVIRKISADPDPEIREKATAMMKRFAPLPGCISAP